MSQLDVLRKHTKIVADSGDIDEIAQNKPLDATTNPSLIFEASENPKYRHLVENAIHYAKKHGKPQDRDELVMDKVFVNFGSEILKHIPGRISTEVDAHLSFDIEGSIKKARTLIALYEQEGISKEKVLIKLASTWEGAQACRALEKEGIHCNMTLLFSLPQAIICADAGATLISPFVGRILDWYKKQDPKATFSPEQDPGVLSVTKIYSYYKQHNISTKIMGASFRNKDQITELCGCDLLTISPKLLQELSASDESVRVKLSQENAMKTPMKKLELDEKLFRWLLNEDAMATEKLSEGIRKFAADSNKLKEKLLNALAC